MIQDDGGPPDDELFVRYVRTGEKAPFETLFRRYAPRLTGLFVRSGAADMAGDLVQKTFLHVHRARNDYQEGRPFRPWIYTIALNVRREEARRRARSREVSVEPERVREPSVDPSTSSSTDRLVQRALDQLSDAAREVVVLHWYDGMSFPEIAKMLGATVSAVKVRAHRAYEQLRKILGPESDGS
ncbi:MAG: RNA polymerase sigma factor [Myxococcota bacterium]